MSLFSCPLHQSASQRGGSLSTSDLGPGLPSAACCSLFLGSGLDFLFSISPPGEGKVLWTGQTPLQPWQNQDEALSCPPSEAHSLSK